MIEILNQVFAFFLGLAQSFFDGAIWAPGVIALPGLLSLGISAQLALGTVRAGYFASALTTAWRYKKHGHTNIKEGLIMLGFSFVGSSIGASLILNADPRPLTYFIVGVSIVAILFMIFRKNIGVSKVRKISNRNLALIGLAVGLVSGAIGIGGSVVSVVSLLILGGYTMKESIGLSAVRSLGNQSAALIVFALAGKVIWQLSLFLVVGSIIGAFVGSEVGHRLPNRLLKFLFIGMTTIFLIKIVFFGS